MTFCFCIDDDTHVVVHDDVIHRDYSRVINKYGKKNEVNLLEIRGKKCSNILYLYYYSKILAFYMIVICPYEP